MSVPRVSVVILCYEHEPFIARALDSVLEQEGCDYEIVIGDDCSSDASREIISHYAEAHPDRVLPFFPDHNLGLDGKLLFQELLDRARGEYVATLDGDDYWTSPAKLARQTTHLDAHPDCSLCFHNAELRHEDGSRPPVRYNPPDQPADLDLHALIEVNPVATSSVMYRRALVEPLPRWYLEQRWGDWQMCLIAAMNGRIRYLPEVMAVHVNHPAGMFSRLSEVQALEGIVEIQEGMRGIVPHELEWRRRQALAYTQYKRADALRRIGELEAARACLRESMRVWPFDAHRLRRRGEGEIRRAALWLRLHVAEPVRRRIAGGQRR